MIFGLHVLGSDALVSKERKKLDEIYFIKLGAAMQFLCQTSLGSKNLVRESVKYYMT